MGTTTGGAPSNVRQGDDARMAALVNDMNNGTVGAVIFYNANPVFNHPLGAKVKSGIAKVPLTISLNDRLDETGSLCQYAAPDSHWLESWNDFEPKRGYLSLAQPAITPLFATRQAQESLLHWAGNNTQLLQVPARQLEGHHPDRRRLGQSRARRRADGLGPARRCRLWPAA